MSIGLDFRIGAPRKKFCQPNAGQQNRSPTFNNEDGTTLYHAGDTGIFESMKTFGELYPIDLAMLPIGSVFTMDPVQAARATRMISPRKVIPMHFKTFPILVQDPSDFIELTKKEAPNVEVIRLNPGEEYTYSK